MMMLMMMRLTKQPINTGFMEKTKTFEWQRWALHSLRIIGWNVGYSMVCAIIMYFIGSIYKICLLYDGHFSVIRTYLSISYMCRVLSVWMASNHKPRLTTFGRAENISRSFRENVEEKTKHLILLWFVSYTWIAELCSTWESTLMPRKSIGIC